MLHTRRLLCLPLLLLMLGLSLHTRAERPDVTLTEDWPGWRGPRGDGTSLERGIATRWSATENVRWKTALPGSGYSSPIVWRDRIYVTWCVEKDLTRVLACLSKTDGRVLWQKTVLVAPLEPKHGENSYASATPATDGQHVWVAFGNDAQRNRETDMVVVCYTMDGAEVWRVTPGKVLARHGFCSCPTLYKDLVILNGDQDGDGYLVALDKATGKERWRVDRPNKTRSYCAPLIVQAGGRTQMVLSGSKCVTGYDPDTGKLLWIVDGPTEQYVASLVLGEDVFFLTTGYPEYHLMGIRPDGNGNVTNTHVVWHHKRLPAREASYVPSPVAHGPHFFVVSDRGTLTCLEGKTGKRLWMKQLGRHHHASILCAGGLLYIAADEGDVYVVRAGAEFELVARNSLDEEIFASPALAGGDLLIRTVGHLYCIREKPKK